ncbi:MAG: hypothetical protein ACRBHB_17095 [Arenicella sp.]
MDNLKKQIGYGINKMRSAGMAGAPFIPNGETKELLKIYAIYFESLTKMGLVDADSERVAMAFVKGMGHESRWMSPRKVFEYLPPKPITSNLLTHQRCSDEVGFKYIGQIRSILKGRISSAAGG